MKSLIVLRAIVAMLSLTCISWGLLQTSLPVLDQQIRQLDQQTRQLDRRVNALATAYDAHREIDVTVRLAMESRISKIEARLDIMIYLLVGIALAAGTTLVDTGYRIASGARKRTNGSNN